MASPKTTGYLEPQNQSPIRPEVNLSVLGLKMELRPQVLTGGPRAPVVTK